MENIANKIRQWLTGKFDEETKKQIKYLLEHNEKELIDSFYKNLEFGTGGLRGKMGVGTNRINKYTIGLATQGLANYLHKFFRKVKEIKVVIAHDTRNNSRFFAETAANVLSANNIKVYLFEDFRPTPELSFAIRALKAQAGIVITASHNPKEYNGYKVYWDDGGQIISPHDKNILQEIENIGIEDIKFEPVKEKIQIIGEDIDSLYLAQLKTISLNPEIVKEFSGIKIVYTPLHGTGIKLIPRALELYGFKNIEVIQEQAVPDGNFPTVKSPNPENPEALEMAISYAQKNNADIVLATDPDTDRLAVAVNDGDNNFVLLNGNQIGSIFSFYILNTLKNRGLLQGREYIVKTIVTTDLIKNIASYYDTQVFEVLTGFKYVAEKIRKYENDKIFLGGFEESFGYLIADFVRDKDAVMSALFISEILAWTKKLEISLLDLLNIIYLKFGFFKEKLVNLVKEGPEGAEEISRMMDAFRNETPAYLNDTNIVVIKDYLTGLASNIFNGQQEELDLPKSNVIQFILEDGSKITVRPSGTEPKIKFYISVHKLFDTEKINIDFENLENNPAQLKEILSQYRSQLDEADKLLKEKVEGFLKSLGL